MDYCKCGDNKGRCIDCAEEEIKRLQELWNALKIPAGEVSHVAATIKSFLERAETAEAEVRRLEDENAALASQLTAANEARSLWKKSALIAEEKLRKLSTEGEAE